jgi:predicted phage-related endonuclease
MSTIDQARTDWHAQRSTALGASEIPSIFGEGFESPYCLWARKLGLLPKTDETEPMEVGTLIQPVIVELLRRRTSLEIVEAPQNEFIRSPEHSFIGCTPDARIFDDSRPTPGVCEIKNVGHYLGSEWNDGPPLRVMIQTQAQMYVTGYDWGVCAGLVGGNQLKWHTVERDEKFIAVMVRECVKFWQLIQDQVPPAVDGSERTRRALQAMHPLDSGETVALPDEFAAMAVELESLDHQADEINVKREQIRNAVREAMGTNTFGLLPDGSGWSWKTATRKSYTVSESTSRTLRRIKAKGK